VQSPSRSHGGNPRSARLVVPLLLIIAGSLFLLNNLGVLPWSIWLTLAQLWPIILIMLGIEIVLGRRGGMLSAAVTLIVLVVVVAVVIVVTLRHPVTSTTASPFQVAASAGPPQTQTATATIGAASSGDVTLRFPAGKLSVGALPTKGDDLLDATTTMPRGMHLSQQSTLRDGVRQVVLTAGGAPSVRSMLPLGWPFGPTTPDSEITWNVQLAPTTPLTLRADLGAGQSDFDMTGLMVQQLTVHDGAGQTTIHFPANAAQTVADVQDGAGQLTLIVPPGVGAYLHTSSGASVDVHVPADRFQRVSDGYETANYAAAPNRLDVTLHLGAGSVDVQ